MAQSDEKLTFDWNKTMIKGRIPFLSEAEELAPVDAREPLGELPVPTLDERVLFYLRAVHGNRDFTEEERSNARNLLLNSMAAEIAAQVIPAEQSPKGELAGRETNAASNITYEYKGFKVIYGNTQSGRIASIYQDGQLRSWASDLEAAVQWIDESTHGADGDSSLVSRLEKSAQTQERAIEPEVMEPRPLHPYEAGAQHWQSAQRKGAIRVAPIASRRTSILAVGATLGLVLIVTGGTLGYQWTYPHMADEVTAPAQQASVPPPAISPRSLSTGPAPDEVKAPAQHVLQIVSKRSGADVVAVFSRLQKEHPVLLGQATLKPLRPNISRSAPSSGDSRINLRPAHVDRVDPEPQSFTAQIGPFASEEDAAAVCRALEAADIQCLGQRKDGASD
jgi:hypothetical protein